MPGYEKYTIGWVCFAANEYIAARAILDEEHDQPTPISPRVKNAYTFGTIHQHNVVITQCESFSAAVAEDIRHVCPDIKFILVVTTGFPISDHNQSVEHGDVVISTAQDVIGGVFEYEVLKNKAEWEPERLGFHYTAPPFLQVAANKLKMRHLQQPSWITHLLQDAAQKSPVLQKWSHRPENDDVCSSDNVKQKGTGTSDGTNSEGNEGEDGPIVHYGCIASGETDVKSDSFAQQLVEVYDVLCISHGVAEVFKNFPCLAVLGIRQREPYPTSKSIDWHRYAAAAAAAYARELLTHIPLASTDGKDSNDTSTPLSNQETTASTSGFARDNTWSSLRSRQHPTHQIETGASSSTLAPAPSSGGSNAGTSVQTRTSSFTSIVFHPQTLVLMLVTFFGLSAMMISFSVSQQREPQCKPSPKSLLKDDGFFASLSQFFILALSVYCTTYPVVRDSSLRDRITKFYFKYCLASSLLLAILSIVVYAWEWKAATILSFLSGYVQLVLVAQLAVCLESGSKPENEADSRSRTSKLETGHDR